MSEAGTQAAVLLLEDGTVFKGVSCGAPGEQTGEIAFSTAMVGYPEIISAPANATKIMVMGYPQIGNYGIVRADLESQKAQVRALVLRDICDTPSNYRSELSLREYLLEQDVVAVSEVDTRALVLHIRDKGSMRAIVSTNNFDAASLLRKLKESAEQDALVSAVSQSSTSAPWIYDAVAEEAYINEWFGSLPQPRYQILVYDLGIAKSELRALALEGCKATVLPWDYAYDSNAGEPLGFTPDGIYLSNGPGDPHLLEATIKNVQALRRIFPTVPVFGVGLGEQVRALTVGEALSPDNSLQAGCAKVMSPYKEFAAQMSAAKQVFAQKTLSSETGAAHA